MSHYESAINYVDTKESIFLQQGNRDDVSCYTFEELIKELNND